MTTFIPNFGESINDPVTQMYVYSGISIEAPLPQNYSYVTYRELNDSEEYAIRSEFNRLFSEQVQEQLKKISSEEVMNLFLKSFTHTSDNPHFNTAHLDKIRQAVETAMIGAQIENPEKYAKRDGIVQHCQQKLNQLYRKMDLVELKEYFLRTKESSPYPLPSRVLNSLSNMQVKDVIAFFEQNVLDLDITNDLHDILKRLVIKNIVKALPSDEVKQTFIELLIERCEEPRQLAQISHMFLMWGDIFIKKSVSYFPNNTFFEKMISLKMNGDDSKDSMMLARPQRVPFARYTLALRSDNIIKYSFAKSLCKQESIYDILKKVTNEEADADLIARLSEFGISEGLTVADAKQELQIAELGEQLEKLGLDELPSVPETDPWIANLPNVPSEHPIDADLQLRLSKLNELPQKQMPKPIAIKLEA